MGPMRETDVVVIGAGAGGAAAARVLPAARVPAMALGARPLGGARAPPLLNAGGKYISGGELGCVSARDPAVYRDTGTNWRVTEGYGAVIEAYAAPLDLRLDCPVTLIDHSGPRLRVATPRGDISARAAILAVPASILARGALRVAPALPDKRAA